MKNIKKYLGAALLIALFALPAFAGDMLTGIHPPPPPTEPRMAATATNSPEANIKTAKSEESSVNMLFLLNVMRNILTLV